MKLKRVLSLLLTEDDDAEDVAVNRTFTQIDNAAGRYLNEQSGVKTLAVSAVDDSIAFENLTTARSVLLLVDGDITVKVNGAAVGVAVQSKPGVAVGEEALADRGVFYLEGAVTSIQLSNPSSSKAVRVTYVLLGV